ncbi:MAG TPA: hypothetical protein VE715_08865 [Blastocatellia bacterium]|nr:hypothetical protein [Blastocatellia bacterium]
MTDTTESFTQLVRSHRAEWRPLAEPGVSGVFVKALLGKDHLYAGDYLYTSPNGKHAAWSENGCIALVNAPQQVEILKSRK